MNPNATWSRYPVRIETFNHYIRTSVPDKKKLATSFAIKMNISRFGFEGDRQETSSPKMFEWTLEHHKKCVDTFILLGSDKEKVGVHNALKAELLSLAGCCCRSFYLDFHISLLGVLQKSSEALFSSNKVTLESLYVAPQKMSSSWTLEHHQRVVEAVIQLGGLSSSKTTPKAVLKLMDEEDRRQGLTTKMIAHHLLGLYHLQKETQRLIAFGLAGGEEERELALRELRYVVFNGLPQQRNSVLCTKVKDPLLRQHLGLLKQVNMSHQIRLQIMKSEWEVLRAFK